MKKGAALLLPCVLGLFVACASLNLAQKPKASIQRFDIDAISLRDITFLFDIAIDNPYPVGLRLDDIGITFSVEQKQVFKTSTGKGLKIRASGRENTVCKVNLLYSDLAALVQNYTSKDYLDCVADVVIRIPIPGLGSYPLSFQLKQRIPAVKPNLSIANFKVRTPSLDDVSKAMKKARESANPQQVLTMLTGIIAGKKTEPVIDPADLDLQLGVDFDIVLKNKTRAKIAFNNLNYDFLVNGEKFIQGSTANVVAGGDGCTVRVSNTFSTRALTKSLIKALTEKEGTFGLTGSTAVKFPDAVKKEPVVLTFDEKGSIEFK